MHALLTSSIKLTSISSQSPTQLIQFPHQQTSMTGLIEEEKGKAEENKEVITKEGEEKSIVESVREKLKEVKIENGDDEKMAKEEVTMEEEEEVVKVENEVKKAKESEKEEENVKMEVEPKTRVSFPVKLADGKELASLGLRRKTIIGFNVKIYAFGIYADNAKLKEFLKKKFGKAPPKPTKELYEAVINSDIGMVVRLIIVLGSLTMNMVRKNLDEGLGASIKKLNGGQKNVDLVNKVMGAANDSIKLSARSVIEISRLPGYILQTKVKGEQISEVESELLCRAFFNLYLGDDPFDKEAKEKFGKSLFSLF